MAGNIVHCHLSFLSNATQLILRSRPTSSELSVDESSYPFNRSLLTPRSPRSSNISYSALPCNPTLAQLALSPVKSITDIPSEPRYADQCTTSRPTLPGKSTDEQHCISNGAFDEEEGEFQISLAESWYHPFISDTRHPRIFGHML